MVSHYQRHRRDEVHGEIVSALVRSGHSVLDLSQVGGGCPDILVSRAGVTILAELKTPTPATRKDKDFSKKQRIFRNKWKDEIVLATSAEDVIEEINQRIRRRENG